MAAVVAMLIGSNGEGETARILREWASEIEQRQGRLQ